MKTYWMAYSLAIALLIISLLIGTIVVTDAILKLLFTLIFPILAFFTADKFTTYFDLKTNLEKQTSKIISSIPSTTSFLLLDNSRIAFDYIITAIERAKEIRNTRISINPSRKSYVSDRQIKMDEKIKKLLKSGVNYSYVVSNKYSEDIINFRKYTNDNKVIGQFRGKELPNVNFPSINFMIITYRDSKELLMGWAGTSDWDHTRPVFLIREQRIIEYYEILHDQLLSI